MKIVTLHYFSFVEKNVLFESSIKRENELLM